MHKAHQSRLTALLAVWAVTTPAAAVEFTALLTPQALTPNDPANWVTPNSATTIFSWGSLNNANNSLRTLTYTGTQQYRLNSITIASTVLNSYTASGDNSTYSNAAFTLLSQLRASITVTQGGVASTPQIVNLASGGTFLAPRAISATNLLPAVTNRTITSNTAFDFRFYESTPNMAGSLLPDAVYTQPVMVTFNATAINPTLGVTPPLTFAAARAGSGTTSTASATLSNTGDADSVLTGTAGAASGAAFAGGPHAVSIKQGTTQAVGYSFTALGSLGGASSAVVSTGTAAIQTNGGNQDLTLQGTTVGPAFQLSGTGVSAPTGGTITFDNVLITKNGPQGAKINALTVTNAFTDAGNLYDNTLTGLTVTNATWTGSDAFSGAPSATVIPDNSPGNVNTRNFNMTFAPTTGVAGVGQTYNANVTFETDVNATLGAHNANNSGNFVYALTGKAYQATLAAPDTPAAAVDFGFVRQGGATPATQTAKTRTVSVQNVTGGNFAMNNVTFGDATGVTSNATFTSLGNANVGSVAGGANGPGGAYGQRTYELRAATPASDPATTPRALEGQITVTSDEAPGVKALVKGTGVGPVFDFSGKDVNFTDHGTCGGTAVCGTLDLGTVTTTTLPFALTLKNLFGDLSGLTTEANLTLINVGFGDAYTQESTSSGSSGTGTFSLSKNLSGGVLGPVGRLNNSDITNLSFTGSAPGTATGFNASLRFLTDVNSLLGVAGTEFRFNIIANWDGTSGPVPTPGSISLIGLGLAGLAGLRRRRG